MIRCLNIITGQVSFLEKVSAAKGDPIWHTYPLLFHPFKRPWSASLKK
jgi:hypothetical protein